MFLRSIRLWYTSKLNSVHLIGPKRNNMFFKSYSNDGTLLQLTPDSVFKYGSFTRYWSGTVFRCYWMDWLRNKIINNLKKKTSPWIWRWISHWGYPNVGWQWLVTTVAWAVSWPLNSEKHFHSWSKVQCKSDSDYVYSVLLYENDFAARFMTACHNIWFVSIKVLY